MAKKAAPANLPLALRAVLERHGVIEAAPVPEFGELVGSVRRLGGTLTVRSMGELGNAATVEMDGDSCDAGDADPALAVAEAFAQALKATFPTQSEMFEGESSLNGGLRHVYAESIGGPR